MSRWLLDFAGAAPGDGDSDGVGETIPLAGFVRLELHPDEGVAWYWTYLVGVPGFDGVLVVRDHEVPLPRVGLEIRADGLWAELTCETAAEHWTFGLEAFGIRLDEPADALRPGGEIGERLPIGLDLEWEVGPHGPPAGTVHGEVLAGRARFEIDGTAWFYADTDAGPRAVDGETLATVFVRSGAEGGGHRERRLVRADGGCRWSGAPA